MKNILLNNNTIVTTNSIDDMLDAIAEDYSHDMANQIRNELNKLREYQDELHSEYNWLTQETRRLRRELEELTNKSRHKTT